MSTLARLALGCGLFLVGGCDGSSNGAKPVAPEAGDNLSGTVEVVTWWTNPELGGLNAIESGFTTVHPGVTFLTTQVADSVALGNTIQTRLVQDAPPSAFQANLGVNAISFAANGEAQPLTGHTSWSSSFDPGVMATLTAMDTSGHSNIIGVPVCLTRQNDTFWDLATVAKIGDGKVPIGFANFQQWLATAAAAGYTKPICVGDVANWTSAHLIFEGLMPAVVGKDYHNKFWTGGADPSDTQWTQFIATLGAMLPYINLDPRGSWSAAVDKMMDHTVTDPSQKCVLTVMGDWAGAYLLAPHGDASAGYVLDEPDQGVHGDFAMNGFPGAETLFVFSGDAFLSASGAANQEVVFSFFDYVASAASQVSFARIKGCVPARTNLTSTDLGSATFSSVVQTNRAAYALGSQGGFKVISHPKTGTSYFLQLTLAAKNAVASGSTDPITSFISANYSQLR